MIVEHVNVHTGGQAVVGTVQSPGGEKSYKPEKELHARQIAPALKSTMSCPNMGEDASPAVATRLCHLREVFGPLCGFWEVPKVPSMPVGFLHRAHYRVLRRV